MVRRLLRARGQKQAEIVGVLFVPQGRGNGRPEGSAEGAAAMSLANAHAAFLELGAFTHGFTFGAIAKGAAIPAQKVGERRKSRSRELKNSTRAGDSFVKLTGTL